MMRILLFVAFSILCVPSFAADWVKVRTRDINQHWFDRDKMQIENDTITYWRRVEFRTPQQTKAGLAYSALYRERIDCKAHTLRTQGYLLYAKDTKVIENVNTPDPEPEAIIPETLGDQFDKLMCVFVAQQRAAQPAGAIEPAPRTTQELRDEIELLEARMRLLRDQLEERVKAEAASNADPAPR